MRLKIKIKKFLYGKWLSSADFITAVVLEKIRKAFFLIYVSRETQTAFKASPVKEIFMCGENIVIILWDSICSKNIRILYYIEKNKN